MREFIRQQKIENTIARLEEFFIANRRRTVHMSEICEATGVSERTLRVYCREHLGLSPIRYIWLRRMQLARDTLLRAERKTVTVTEVATEYGFWELGRFSVNYRAIFGESPSATLLRPSQAVSSNALAESVQAA